MLPCVRAFLKKDSKRSLVYDANGVSSLLAAPCTSFAAGHRIMFITLRFYESMLFGIIFLRCRSWHVCWLSCATPRATAKARLIREVAVCQSASSVQPHISLKNEAVSFYDSTSLCLQHLAKRPFRFAPLLTVSATYSMSRKSFFLLNWTMSDVSCHVSPCSRHKQTRKINLHHLSCTPFLCRRAFIGNSCRIKGHGFVAPMTCGVIFVGTVNKHPLRVCRPDRPRINLFS